MLMAWGAEFFIATFTRTTGFRPYESRKRTCKCSTAELPADRGPKVSRVGLEPTTSPLAGGCLYAPALGYGRKPGVLVGAVFAFSSRTGGDSHTRASRA